MEYYACWDEILLYQNDDNLVFCFVFCHGSLSSEPTSSKMWKTFCKSLRCMFQVSRKDSGLFLSLSSIDFKDACEITSQQTVVCPYRPVSPSSLLSLASQVCNTDLTCSFSDIVDSGDLSLYRQHSLLGSWPSCCAVQTLLTGVPLLMSLPDSECFWVCL